jgi:MSHA biogenesis protein MshO
MRARHRGFTLIELVVVITLSAVVMGFMAMFLVAPVNAYFAQERRTDLADSANNAMRMLENDIRGAVPNSVRVLPVDANHLVMEMLAADAVARYGADLTIGTPDNAFTAIGGLAPDGASYVNNAFLVIDNGPGGDAYAQNTVSTPAVVTITAGVRNPLNREQPISVSPPVRFVADSPIKNVYFGTHAVAYLCDTSLNTLTRYSGYQIAANQNSRATDFDLMNAGAQRALVARNVSQCTFAPQPVHSTYFGDIIRMQLNFTSNGEILRVFHQAQVEGRT